MRTTFKSFLVLLAVALSSCAGHKTSGNDDSVDAVKKTYSYTDSCEHLLLSFTLEVPTGDDSVSLMIRDSLVADFIRNAQQPGNDVENNFAVKPYDGDKNDIQAIINYYGKADYDYLLKLAKSDYDERMQYVKEDTTMTDEDKKAIMDNVPQWAFDLKIKEMSATPEFIVYNSEAYVYFGGAHGGIIGSGAMTFNKATGHKIQRFVAPSATQALQPLFRKGLVKYFCECGDSITEDKLNVYVEMPDNIIPQPLNNAYPNATGDSLIFTYRQYEIAPYAAGMPSFALAIKDIQSYLTEEGKAIVNKGSSAK